MHSKRSITTTWNRGPSSRRSSSIETQLSRAQLSLTRALKLAKAFERQKLGRRQKTANTTSAHQDAVRITTEIDALKKLDIPALAKHHFNKVLLRTKSIANSPLLPATITVTPLDLSSVEQNVIARLFNARVVKETIHTLLSNIQLALGIEHSNKSSNKTQRRLNVQSPEKAKADVESRPANEDILSESNVSSVENLGLDEDEEMQVDKCMSASEDTTSSTVEETFNRPNKSAFLPTLTAGGYWSGSDSEDDIEDVDDDIAPRKNRRGQRARQQIWERKYGSKANHLRKMQEGRKTKYGQDFRRRATGGLFYNKSERKPLKDTAPKAYGSGGNSKNNRGGDYEVRETQIREGPLHPSWEAARKSKQQMIVPSEGKKIVFD